MPSAEKPTSHLCPGKQEPPNRFRAVVYLTKHSASHKARGNTAEDEVKVLSVGSHALASCQQKCPLLPGLSALSSSEA